MLKDVTEYFTKLITSLFLIIIMISLTSCGIRKPVSAASELKIINLSRKTLTRLEARKCQSKDQSFYTLMNLKIETSQAITVSLPNHKCMDLRAVDEKDELLGTQSQLTVPPNVIWKIR